MDIKFLVRSFEFQNGQSVITGSSAMSRNRLNSFEYTLISLVLLFVYGILAGCFTKILHSTVHPSFTYNLVISSEIGIFGLTSILGNEEQRKIHREELPSMLLNSMHHIRNEYQTLGPKRIRELLPQEEYDQILRQYENSGALDSNSINTLSNTIGDSIRFVIIGRVEKEDLDWIMQDNDEDTNFIVARRIYLSLEIYDLQAKGLVSKSLISSKGSDYNTVYYAPDDDDEGDRSNYPPPPELNVLIKKVFDKFADNLPSE